MSKDLLKQSDCYQTIRIILQESREKAYSQINSIMVDAYWQIGKRIVEEEQKGEARADYGKSLIAELSRQLGDEFGKGFSVANLQNFRKFYLIYPEQGKAYTLCTKLSWSHNRLIMREKDDRARLWYLTEAQEQNWSVRQLERQIKTQTFERLLNTSSGKSQEEGTPTLSPEHILKDPYILEFLNIPENKKLHESTLETALINNLQTFLLELGKGFSFVGRQFRISSETSHFYIDLVFYNYLLKCFVLIDLKTDKLVHQDIGQMDMYVRMFDDLKRGHDDNPTLGIILCADKDETVVRYSVLNDSEQLFASKYLRVLPNEKELVRELESRHILEFKDDQWGED
ncbi:PDDEXK nuclease domain-containing protein [Thiofilum flexile]|uniref:PDDEXK nuclease domain-containing protein n=1 Tax=Thiofilum flexile TaxID=125627 RepID=UPI00036B6435|nr:PDDEXK nuclease domain-containing protein [Thiofilum flexile]